MRDPLSVEEKFLKAVIISARRIQTFLWGEADGSWGLEEWRRMFVKRYNKIFAIDSTNPHAIVELKKRLLQNAALCIALLAILHFKRPVDIVNDKIPSNLKAYTSHTGDDNG